ncbi:hypothetical protein [Anaeromyxobacter oryzae]|uniref:Uncharacterized protein n=1 Tax=Anaeromyxobacter oryzae TaxID=2918170 RepID=A0ABM7WPM0_9BACT|nr:hypothetical protein [Anaeromyxobacter oryzae]BDG01409.1 hypothetical protein AMOR_04050 [Anaeromyxobacter oryzae]
MPVFRLARAAVCATLAAALALAAPRVFAADTVLPFGIPGHGRLQLAIPEGWQVEARRIEEPGGLTMRLAPVDGPELRVLVTVMVPPNGPTTVDALRAGAERNARDLQGGAAEEKLPVEERSGPAAHLAFVSATDKRWQDREPPEGEWRHVTQGAAATGDLLLVFTVLGSSKDAPARARALELLASARHLPAGTGPNAIRVAAGRRTLAAELPGLDVLRVGARPGGGGAMVMGTLPGGFAVTLTVERTTGLTRPEEVRQRRWTEGASRSPLEKKDVQLSSRGDMAVVGYLVPRVEAAEVRQRHVHGYLLREDFAGEVHLSKIRYVPEDAPALERLLGSARLE